MPSEKISLDDYYNFQPVNEEERKWVKQYNDASKFISVKMLELSEGLRVQYLRSSSLSDVALMNLYLQALKKEDFETCAAAKALLLEKGYTQIPS